MSDVTTLTRIAELAMRLGEVERTTTHPDGRRETDTTHTVMLALAAMYGLPRSPAPLHLGRVLMFCLVHDLPEAYAGDVCTARGLDEAHESFVARDMATFRGKIDAKREEAAALVERRAAYTKARGRVAP